MTGADTDAITANDARVRQHAEHGDDRADRDDRHVRQVGSGCPQERISVADLGDHVESRIDQESGDPLIW